MFSRSLSRARSLALVLSLSYDVAIDGVVDICCYCLSVSLRVVIDGRYRIVEDGEGRRVRLAVQLLIV